MTRGRTTKLCRSQLWLLTWFILGAPCPALPCPALPRPAPPCPAPPRPAVENSLEPKHDRKTACSEGLSMLSGHVCTRTAVLFSKLSSSQQAMFLCMSAQTLGSADRFKAVQSHLHGCTGNHAQAVTSHSASVKMAPICIELLLLRRRGPRQRLLMPSIAVQPQGAVQSNTATGSSTCHQTCWLAKAL